MARLSRALGATRDLREPEEIFTGILDEGEEVTLVSGLKLCRKVVHREPVIELIGVDPYKFAEIRSLGLINEQIDWKQRFFVPTDEETGVTVLTDLLTRYPVVVGEELADDESIVEIQPAEPIESQVINLDEWVIPKSVEAMDEADSGTLTIAKAIEITEATLTLPDFYFARRPK